MAHLPDRHRGKLHRVVLVAGFRRIEQQTDEWLRPAALCNFCLLRNRVAARVTNWDGVRPTFRAAWVMRAISSWVASTRTLTMSRLLNFGLRFLPDSRCRSPFGWRRRLARHFRGLEPRV